MTLVSRQGGDAPMDSFSTLSCWRSPDPLRHELRGDPLKSTRLALGRHLRRERLLLSRGREFKTHRFQLSGRGLLHKTKKKRRGGQASITCDDIVVRSLLQSYLSWTHYYSLEEAHIEKPLPPDRRQAQDRLSWTVDLDRLRAVGFMPTTIVTRRR